MKGGPGLTDGELLEALDLRDGDGMTYAAIAKRLRVTRNTVLAALHRIDEATVASAHDGTLPRGWWRDGLARQAGQ